MNPLRSFTWPGHKIFLTVLLSLMLIAGQAAASAHSHGDSRPVVDCELCLQLTHILPSNHVLPQAAACAVYHSPAGAESPFLVLRAACARGPPGLLS